jgi:PIN domain nuclease of toxin-antitoxin system
MNLLLDTCTFLWLVLEPTRLSKHAADDFRDPANTCFLSVVSEWEIGILVSLGRVGFDRPAHEYVPDQRLRHGIKLLSLDEQAALHVPELPQLHRDPFDRMLVSQAIVHSLAIVTPDSKVAQYPVTVIW